MSKEAYYFSHDSNANRDPKILKLRSKHGWQGYGIYWAVIETLREQENFNWKASDKQLLSFCFGGDEALVAEVVDTCLEVGLLAIDDDDNIHSESLTRRMEMKNKVSEKRRAAGRKGGSSKSQANAKQKPSKESKEKESKGKESIKRKEEGDPIIDQLIENKIVAPGSLSKTLADDLTDVEENFGFKNPKRMIVLAIQDAARGNGRTWKFIYNKLDLWRKQGVRTEQDLTRIQSFPPSSSKLAKKTINWEEFDLSEQSAGT